jgi:hypothetical protein
MYLGLLIYVLQIPLSSLSHISIRVAFTLVTCIIRISDEIKSLIFKGFLGKDVDENDLIIRVNF